MKRLNYLMSILLACMLSIGLAGCSSDDGGITPTPPSPVDIVDIVGTWQCTSSVDNIGGQSEIGLMVGKRITLNENGTFTSSHPGLGSSGTFTLTGSTLAGQSSLGTFTASVSLTDNIMHWGGTACDGSTFQYGFTRVSNDAE